jgi:hypothetical protein
MTSGVHQSFAPLVDGVVVGEVQMSKTVLPEGVQPFRLCPEDEPFEDGGLDLRGRTFEVAHDNLGGTEHGVDAFREQMVDSVLVDYTAHPAIEQDIACENDI